MVQRRCAYKKPRKSRPPLPNYSRGFLFRGALTKAACCTPKGQATTPVGAHVAENPEDHPGPKKKSCNTHFLSRQASPWLSWTTSLAVAYNFAVGCSEPGRKPTPGEWKVISVVPDTAMRVWRFEEADKTVCI